MTVHVTQFAEGLPRRGFTVAEVERMAELGIFEPDERFELLGGEIVPESPKSVRHERIKNWIDRELTLAFGREVGVGSDNQFTLSENTFVLPDVIVYDLEYDLTNLTAANALLAIEVSASSLRSDLRRKAELYAACGVREVWVVEATELTTFVHKRPSPTGYREITQVPRDRTVEATFIDASLRFADFEN